MALSLLGGPQVFFLQLRLWLLTSASALEVIHQGAPELTCSEGVTDCFISSASPYPDTLPDPNDAVNVTHVQLKPMLCCSATHNCELCLQIIITVQEVFNAMAVSEESGHYNDEEEVFALVKVCLSYPGIIGNGKILQFTPNHTQVTHKLLLTEKMAYSIPVLVTVCAHSKGGCCDDNNHTITLPSLQEVCSMKLEETVKECDAPSLRVETDQKTNVIILQLEGTVASQDELMCQMFWNEMPGEVLVWPKGKKKLVISSDFVAPCLCFQVWWQKKSIRRKFCPFEKQRDALERMQHNVSLTVVESPLREGGIGLNWNVTAPCRLDADVWLCNKDLAGGHCEEVMGSRQILQSNIDAGWSATRKGHWKTGEFNVPSHPLLCIQIKLWGIDSCLEPQCPFTTSRWRWSLPLLIGLLSMCLIILGAYFLHGVLKGYVWKWLKEDDVKGAVGGGHVVLLYSPDDSRALPELMCDLASSLQALGFSVSLDLWSHVELSILGPVPWLHSRLDQLKRQGGKVVLVLTQDAWIRAEQWGAQSWERNSPREGNRGGNEEAERSYPASKPCVDVFSASLSCILADYLQGQVGKRFMLVQFESLPPEPPGGFQPLPELFRGLHVYSLPSQSLGFLTELAGARQVATASARRKRAGGLRMASQALAKGLSGFTSGTNVLHLAGVSQSSVGVGAEDSGETVPFQLYLVTPTSSPDTHPKVREKEWV